LRRFSRIASLEVAVLKQFVTRKDEVLTAINGKDVTAALVAEIRLNFTNP